MTTKLISLAIVFAILAWTISMNCARADILCGTDVVMGAREDHLFSRAGGTGKYREYPIIGIEGTKITAITQYGKVTVTLNDVPIVVWTNREGDVEPQTCAYIPVPVPPAPQQPAPIAPQQTCHDEEYPIMGQYGPTGYGHRQVCR